MPARRQHKGRLYVGASAEARLEFEYQPLQAGATLSLGDVTIGVLATLWHNT